MRKGKYSKVKRVLAFVLVFSMVLSLGSAVFAAEDDPVTAIEERLAAFKDKNLNSDEAKQLAADYKALSDKQKEELDVVLVNNFLYAASRSITYTNEESFVAAMAELVGPFTENQQAARELHAVAYGKVPVDGILLANSTKFVDEANPEAAAKNSAALDKLNKMYQESNDYTRDYADFYLYGSGIVKPVSASNFYSLKGMITLNFNREIQKAPWAGLTEDQQAKYGSENAYKDSLYHKVFKALPLSKDMRVAFDTAMETAEAYKYFWANDYDASKLGAAIEKVDAFNRLQSLVFNKYTTAVVHTYKSIADFKENKTAMMSYKDVIANARLAMASADVDAFVTLINSIEEPYNNEHVKQTMEIYNKISDSLKFFQAIIPEGILEKYEAIQAAYVPVAPATPSEEKPDISGFEPTVYAYSQGVTHTRAQEALESVNTMLAGLGLDLPKMLSEGVYTNKTVTDAMSLIYSDLLQSVLEGIDMGGASFMVIAPDKIGATLTEAKFSGIKAKLTSAKVADWKTVETANGDWGFRDGDKDGFVQAIAAGLRKVMDVVANGYATISAILTLPNWKTSNGDHYYGAYEDLIPILEGLGLEGIISSEEYTAAYDAVTGSAKYDALLLPILNPIFDLVDKIANDPINTLIDLLPRLGKLVSDGTLNTQLQKVLARITAFELPALDFTADGLNTMLDGLLAGIRVGADEEAGIEGIALKYSPIDFASLAGMGTLEVKDSVSAYNLYRSDIKADRGMTFAALLDYVLGFTEANAGALDTILGGIDALAQYKDLILSILSDKESGTQLLYTLLAPVKDVVVKDPDTNITVEGDSATLPSDVELKIETVTSGETYEKVKEALRDSAEKFIIYDFTFTSDGVEVHPDGSVTVRIPVPAGYDVNNLVIYHVMEDGSLKKVDFKEENGMIVFTTDSFSSYVVAQLKTETPKPEDPTQKPGDETTGGDGSGSPETGDAAISAVVFAAMAAGAGVVLLKKKKHA